MKNATTKTTKPTMKTATMKNTKPTNTIVYDAQTAQHASEAVNVDLLLLADAKRLGGVASKEWRFGLMVGTIAAIAKKPQAYACEVLVKAAPGSKGTDKAVRTKAEQKLYDAARTRLSRFCKNNGITPANKPRGKPGKGSDNPVTTEATPKAGNAKQADAFVRQQAAMLQAYGEKNREVMSHAMIDAILEFSEAVNAIPNQD